MSRISASVVFDTPEDSIVKLTTAGNKSLVREDVGNRLVVVAAELTNAAQTITLPAAIGSGTKVTILNNIVCTQSLVIAALGTDVFDGSSVVVSASVPSADVFATSATSDKYTFNVTTTGGLKGDLFEAWDYAPGKWLVRVNAVGTSTAATGFSAT